MACLSIFWSIPTALLAGTAAAGGIALVNSMGNLSGLVPLTCWDTSRTRPTACPWGYIHWPDLWF